ncbi:MAG TPA: nuclear transport factor 2 family protein [Candidatus Angelobacter sp.]
MRSLGPLASLILALFSLGWAQQPTPAVRAMQGKQQNSASGAAGLKETLEANVKTEWDAFKNKNKQAYSDLLAEDFVAIEDDGEGTRKKSAAVAEVDKSVVNNYHLFALTVLPLDSNAALVTYEITLEFPLKVQVRFKRVLVSEIWLKRNGQWKERYYQETRVK